MRGPVGELIVDLVVWYRKWLLRKAHPCPMCGGKRKLGLYFTEVGQTGFMTVRCNDWRCLYPYDQFGWSKVGPARDMTEVHGIEARSARAALQRYNLRAEWLTGLREG